MKILLLGATGRTGKLVLEEALLKNHTVHCVVRKLPPQQLNDVIYFQGNPDDSIILQQAIQGCEAIISVLNISRTSDFPWARLRTPKTFLSDVMSVLIPLARQNKIERVVICSAWGVSDTRHHIPKWFRWFIDNSHVGIAYADHERQEVLLQNSDLKWTSVRPAGLINTRRDQEVIESYGNHPRPRLTISRLSVARYMIAAVLNDHLVGKSPVISGKF